MSKLTPGVRAKKRFSVAFGFGVDVAALSFDLAPFNPLVRFDGRGGIGSLERGMSGAEAVADALVMETIARKPKTRQQVDNTMMRCIANEER